MSAEEPLDVALHRMSASCAKYLRPRSRVLDVGCGAGASASMLAQLGHTVLGVDPCERTLRVAAATHASSPRLRFEHGGFADFPSRRAIQSGADARLHALLLLEVSQHFDDLDALWHAARPLLTRGGRVVIADVFCVTELPRERVPYHRAEVLLAAAREAGFVLEQRRTLTRRVLPTASKLITAVETECARHLARRDTLHSEFDELARHCRALDSALRNGDLVYELFALRGP